MQQSVYAMKVALRVLDSLTSRQRPDPADVQELSRYAPASANYSLESLDEVACEVIQQALKHRASVRLRMAEQGIAP